jgi:Flp pilus assembly protein TadD
MLVALGWILRTAEWDWRGAEQAFRRALELRSNHAETLAGAAVLLFNVGKEAEAFRLGQQAAQLDPLNAGPHIDLSLMFYFNRNWVESERSARRALQLAPDGASYHSVLGWSLMEQKRYAEAEKEIALEPDAVERVTALGLLAITRSQTAAARQCLDQLETIARTNRDAADLQTSIAWLSAGLGDKERAFAALEHSWASRDPSVSWFRNGHYLLSEIYSDPRWGALLRKVGLTDDQLK